jgi:outer membrane lipoprotein-sorting protein
MKKVFNIIFLIIVAINVQSQTYKTMKDTLTFKQGLDKMAKETQSIESDFTQVKNLSMLSEKITSKGHFWYGGPTLLRWEYFDPYKYIIAINKDKVLIKDEHKTKKYDMNSNKIFKEINDIMVACVNGKILSSGKFKVVYFESDKNFKLELIPLNKGMKESIQKINMYFDKQISSVIRLDMIEANADATTIDFSNKKLNQKIAIEKFHLK